MLLHIFIDLLLMSCGFSTATTENVRGRITGGKNATKAQFPFYVLLRRKANEFNNERIVGGGSLISNEWVLTAAHAVRNRESIALFFGATHLSSTSQLNMTSTNIYMHPGFQKEIMVNDIALIKLPEAVTFNANIKPILLPTFSMATDMLVGVNIIAVGFGFIDDDYPRKIPERLQYAEMIVYPKEICEKKLHLNISKEVFCGKGPMETGTCNGDSGGPALMRGEGESYIQIGIISFGINHRCKIPLPVGLTRVTHFLDWINAATGLVRE